MKLDRRLDFFLGFFYCAPGSDAAGQIRRIGGKIVTGFFDDDGIAPCLYSFNPSEMLWARPSLGFPATVNPPRFFLVFELAMTTAYVATSCQPSLRSIAKISLTFMAVSITKSPRMAVLLLFEKSPASALAGFETFTNGPTDSIWRQAMYSPHCP